MSFDPILKIASLPAPLQVTPLDGGANNRVYKLEFSAHPPLVCKQYFEDPNDYRKRLHAEYSFLKYAWGMGLRNIPQPILSHPETNTALYSFATGRPILLNDMADTLIEQAIQFFLCLNENKSLGLDLPKSSESCLSLNEYLQLTEKRIECLQNSPLGSPLTSELHFFIYHSLYPQWLSIKEWACKAALHDHFSLDHPLSLSEQCISPSDFGFHNALLNPNGTLTFIDFEYAGWDDPCKTVCDFFCQPRIAIPFRYFSSFSEALASITPIPEKCLKRIEILFPVMQIKWCCMLLNIFTQIGKKRRLFSFSEELNRQERQLLLAKELFNKIRI